MPEKPPVQKLTRETGAPPPQLSSRMLNDIRDTPKANWSIENISKACEQLGMNCAPPSHGSHYKVSSRAVSWILTIPSRRPIKVVYIKQFLAFADVHIKNSAQEVSDG